MSAALRSVSPINSKLSDSAQYSCKLWADRFVAAHTLPLASIPRDTEIIEFIGRHMGLINPAGVHVPASHLPLIRWHIRQAQPPMPAEPENAGGTVEFSDIDPRISHTLRVSIDADSDAVAFGVYGKKGGTKAALWLSKHDARELITFLNETLA